MSSPVPFVAVLCLTVTSMAAATTPKDDTVTPSQGTVRIPPQASAQAGDVDPASLATSTSIVRGLSAPYQWTEFRGEVTRVDLKNRSLQIREGTTHSLLDIPVRKNVSIFKDGRNRQPLESIDKGDRVVVRKTAGPS